MPTYQYACTACDHRFEAVQSFSEDSLSVCPVCSGPLRKVFSSVGIVFKGSGFYRTDSRASSGVAAEPKKDGASSTESTTSTGPKHGELVVTQKPNSASKSDSGSSSAASAPSAAAS